MCSKADMKGYNGDELIEAGDWVGAGIGRCQSKETKFRLIG